MLDFALFGAPLVSVLLMLVLFGVRWKVPPWVKALAASLPWMWSTAALLYSMHQSSLHLPGYALPVYFTFVSMWTILVGIIVIVCAFKNDQ